MSEDSDELIVPLSGYKQRVNNDRPSAVVVENPPLEKLTIKSFIRAGCILAAEFCERLAYYSIDANLQLLFKGEMKMTSANANMLVLFWKGTGYMTPLLGGFLADGYLGRYKTIILFIIFYVFAMALLAVGVIPSILASQGWIVYTSLFLVAIAMGGIKANVVTFGADQLQGYAESTQQAFFNWFYFSINSGAILSFTVIAYVQQNISFSIGYAIPAAVMLLSAIFFIGGTSLYKKALPKGSVLSECFSMIYHCFRISKNTPATSFLDRAKFVHDTLGNRMFEDDKVEDLKAFVKVLPVQGTFIIFWCLYAQQSSVMYSQGTYMNLRLGSIELPLPFLQLFNSAVILLLVPIFDRLLYPCLHKRNINFSSLKKIGLGFLFASLSMLYCGVLEIIRKKEYRLGNTFNQRVGPIDVTAVELSVLWQAPGFMFIGVSEVLASITGLQFAYDEAPETMRSMVQAIYLVTTGLGSYFGTALVAAVNAATTDSPWISDDINQGHLDLYFFTLCTLGVLNFFGFLFISDKYSLRKKQPAEAK